MTEILIVEDDPAIVFSLREFLKSEGFGVTAASGVREALEAAAKSRIDLALLDISLADGSGFEVCAAFRQKDLPVIFLTASDDEASVVAGLDLGAEDYIVKPFRPRELVSRIRRVLRRARPGEGLTLGDLFVDPDHAAVLKGGKELFLSPLEYRLLLIFLNHKGEILSREKLLDELWDCAGEYVNDNTLTVYIKRLREKIGDDPQDPAMIRTVRGKGYLAVD